MRDPTGDPDLETGPSPATGTAARIAIHFLCARKYLTLPDTRPAGTIARCPACGRAMTLPPRQPDDPPVRRFDLAC